MAYHYKLLLMTSEMQLPESEATLDEVELNKNWGRRGSCYVFLVFLRTNVAFSSSATLLNLTLACTMCL